MHATFMVNGKKYNFHVNTLVKHISLYDEDDILPEDWKREESFDFPETKWKYKDLQKDENGYYFFKIGDKIYHFSDAVMSSMEDIKKRIDANEHVSDDEFVWAIIHDGVKNVRFFMDMPVPDMLVPELGIALIGDKVRGVPVKLVEGFNTEVYRNYKLELIPDIENADVYICKRRTYSCDIFSMIRSGIIQILPSVMEDDIPVAVRINEYFRNIH